MADVVRRIPTITPAKSGAQDTPKEPMTSRTTFIAAFTVLVCALVIAACNASPPAESSTTAAGARQFVGSASCESCHHDIYTRWKRTLMANVVRDPKQHPDAVIADFSRPNPLVTFSPADVAFVYGSKWKQRYFVRRGDDYFVLPAQWDVQNKTWRA